MGIHPVVVGKPGEGRERSVGGERPARAGTRDVVTCRGSRQAWEMIGGRGGAFRKRVSLTEGMSSQMIRRRGFWVAARDQTAMWSSAGREEKKGKVVVRGAGLFVGVGLSWGSWTLVRRWSFEGRSRFIALLTKEFGVDIPCRNWSSCAVAGAWVGILHHSDDSGCGCLGYDVWLMTLPISNRAAFLSPHPLNCLRGVVYETHYLHGNLSRFVQTL